MRHGVMLFDEFPQIEIDQELTAIVALEDGEHEVCKPGDVAIVVEKEFGSLVNCYFPRTRRYFGVLPFEDVRVQAANWN